MRIRNTARIGKAGAMAAGLAVPGLLGGPVIAEAPPDLGTSAVFNEPGGTEVRDQLTRLIDGAHGGSTIYLSTYLFRDKVVAKHLLAAAKNDVTVKVLADSDTKRKHYGIFKDFAAALKKEGGNSWAKLCSEGCVGEGDSPALHSKFALFSQTLRRSKVSFVTTANLTDSKTGGVGGTKGWNAGYTDVSSDGLYERLRGYFNDLKDEPNLPDYYNHNKPETTGNVKTYFHPRKKGGDTVKNVLDGVDCKKGATVRVSNWWIGRKAVAKKLWDMGQSGCSVDIVANQISMSSCEILAKYIAGAPLHIKGFSRGKRETGNHEKNIMIDGHYLGKNRKITFTGSDNITPSSLSENDEITVRIADSAIHDRFVENFEDVKAAADIELPAFSVPKEDCKPLAP
ncbi:phospholipase D-like domain-containing protein [Spirillospora sp. CA-128828]|uniref:phospholipase D-like domain-containing protein n=1 Tax=Spirillospora sp. CA-128828 TaxID=3240033 RepID=UPI003D8B29CC